MKSFFYLTALLMVLIVFNQCQKENSDNSFEFKDKLSELDIYKGNISDLEVTDGFLPYDLNSPLFSDYAQKQRFVKVPAGKTISYTPNRVFGFPAGTILVKNFFYYNDERNPSLGRRIVETRIMVKRDSAWAVGVYQWNDAQDDAIIKPLGATANISWINAQGQTMNLAYKIPSENDCKGCHKRGGKIAPIGPQARNLQKNYAYSDGSANQLEKWKLQGWLDQSFNPASIAAMPDYRNTSLTLEQRARAYLEINCAHCHTSDGPASNTGLFVEFEQTDLGKLGYCKRPVSAAQGSGNLIYDIKPGSADSSIVVYRMNSVQVGVAMPEIGRGLIHTEGVQLIKDWINSLPRQCN